MSATDAFSVMVVDDDPDVRDALVELLTGERYRVVVATNGREAITRLREAKGHVDLILLDLTMPVMDGVGFRTEQLADPALASIPVIVLSATLSCHQTSSVLKTAQCLRKPIKPEDLLRAVQLVC
jgi:CheY-like chemotaxis protein